MRDDEVHVAIFRGEDLDVPSLSTDIDQHRQAERPGGTDLAGKLRLITMNLEATKPVSPYRRCYHRLNPPGVPNRVKSGKTDETRAMRCD